MGCDLESVIRMGYGHESVIRMGCDQSDVNTGVIGVLSGDRCAWRKMYPCKENFSCEHV